MIFTFIGSMVRVWYARLFGYKVLVDPDIQSVRYHRCINCKFCKEDQCQKCGCLIYAKISLATEQCPIKTWRRVWRKRVTTK